MSSTSSPSTGSGPFKIAVIEMGVLYDPEKGIMRLIRAIESLDQEFEPLRKELRGMRKRPTKTRLQRAVRSRK